jgi:hypothetical protein
VEQWAELRRLQFVGGVSIRELQRRTGLHRTTIRRALCRDEPPRYRRRVGASKLDPFKAEIRRLLREDRRLPTSPGARADLRVSLWGRQDAGLRLCRRPAAAQAPRPCAFQRTVYRRGEVLPFDLWRPAGRCRRARPDAARLGGCGGAGVLACRRGRTDLVYGLGSAPRPARPNPPSWVTFDRSKRVSFRADLTGAAVKREVRNQGKDDRIATPAFRGHGRCQRVAWRPLSSGHQRSGRPRSALTRSSGPSRRLIPRALEGARRAGAGRPRAKHRS